MLSIDPGGTTGLAVFLGGKLNRATHIKRQPGDPIPEEFARAGGPILIEMPIIRPNTPEANDIVKLALHVGDWLGYFKRLQREVQLVWPASWKGSTPKKICHNRVLAALDEDELTELKTRNHNMLDAVGIGLWKLNRFKNQSQ